MSSDTDSTVLNGLRINPIPTNDCHLFHIEVDVPTSMPSNKVAEYLAEIKDSLKKMFPQHTKLIVSRKGQVTIRGE